MAWSRRAAHAFTDEDLSAHADGRLVPARAQELEAHAASCESCRRTLAETTSLKSLLGGLPQAQPRRTLTISPAQAAAGSVRASRPGRFAFVPAAALTLLVALLAVDFLPLGVGTSSDEQAGAQLATSDKATQAESDAFAAPAAVPPTSRDTAPSLAPAPGVAGASGAANVAVPSPAAAAAADSASKLPVAQAGPGEEGRTSGAGQAADDDGGLKLVRGLEVLAALVLIGSVAYVFVRSRTGAA